MAALLSVISIWLVPLFVTIVLVLGMLRGVAVFDTFVDGATEGIRMTIRLLPYLLGMLVAISILRASGVLNAFTDMVSPVLARLHWPSETIPLAMMRPLSGSGAMALTADLLKRFGPDSYIGMVASTMQGSTDTTLFIITVYFGSIGVRRVRHAMWAGLAADLASMLAAVLLCHLLLA